MTWSCGRIHPLKVSLCPQNGRAGWVGPSKAFVGWINIFHLSVNVFKETSCIFTQANWFVYYMSKYFVSVCKITFRKLFAWLQSGILCLYRDQNPSVHQRPPDISAKQRSSGDLTFVLQPGTNLAGTIRKLNTPSLASMSTADRTCPPSNSIPISQVQSCLVPTRLNIGMMVGTCLI